MIRTAAAVLALAVVATSANAAELTVQTQGKSPAEIRAAVTGAAFKACNLAYADDVFVAYKRQGCVRDTVEATLAKIPGVAQTAQNTTAAATVATR
jgi:hypothetical protein